MHERVFWNLDTIVITIVFSAIAMESREKRSMMTFGERSLLRGVFIGMSLRRLLARFMNGPRHLVDLFMLRLTT